ncbi:hypothetical protein [Tsukamurella soli]|uniref:hypothetical protein n=1 Tax=Tsukamurella soli TaxID=644556 RepID=UPI0036233320
MDRKKFGAVALATVAVAATVAGCGKSTSGEKPVSFTPVVGDNFTGNVSAPQTGGVPVPPSGVTMIGNPIAAQAVANSGLPQGTVTATSNNTTVYYPPAPAIPGLVVPPDSVPQQPEPLAQPANWSPYDYPTSTVDVYQQICNTGRWRSWQASSQIQAQTCWTLYGRQLGVRPWYPGDRGPRPWDQPNYPTPWWRSGWHPDAPVVWVYPGGWNRPRPQPIIYVSVTVNIGGNPHAHPDPHDPVPYYPVWAVRPGAPVPQGGQQRITPPLLPAYTSSAATNAYVAPPVAPGVTLPPAPVNPADGGSSAIPGARVVGNANTNAQITTPIFVTGSGSGASLGTTVAPDAASVAAAAGITAPATSAVPGATGGAGMSGGERPGGGVGGGASAGVTVPGGPTAGAGASGGERPGGGERPSGGTGGDVTGGATVPGAPTEAPQTTQAPAPTQAPVHTQAPENTQAPVQTQAPETTVAPQGGSGGSGGSGGDHHGGGGVTPGGGAAQPTATQVAPAVTQAPAAPTQAARSGRSWLGWRLRVGRRFRVG